MCATKSKTQMHKSDYSNVTSSMESENNCSKMSNTNYCWE